MSLLSTAKTMQGMLLQASPYRGKPPWLFSALFFCEQASQLACVGADAELSSNWHSYTLDVFAHAHACRKDSGSRDLKEAPSTVSWPPSESVYADCRDALLQHHNEKGALLKKN